MKIIINKTNKNYLIYFVKNNKNIFFLKEKKKNFLFLFNKFKKIFLFFNKVFICKKKYNGYYKKFLDFIN